MEVSLKSYFKPTPVNIRKFADSLLIGAMYILANPGLLGADYTYKAAIVVIAMKVLSNFFSTGPVQDIDPRNEPSSPN